MRRSRFLIFLFSILFLSDALGSLKSGILETRAESLKEYQLSRSQLIAEAQSLNVSSQSIFREQLTSEEKAVASSFSSMIDFEVSSQWLSGYFPPSHSFLRSKLAIDKSPSSLLQFLRSMPKGANLHTHLTSAASYEWLIYNASYRSDAYLFVPVESTTITALTELLSKPILLNNINNNNNNNNNNSTNNNTSNYPPNPASLGFFPKQPALAGWTSVPALRSSFADPALFDSLLLTSFTMEGRDYGSYEELWDHFDSIFARLDVSYEPVFRGFLLNIFAQNIADGLQHLECRTPPFPLFDESGTELPLQHTFEVMEEVAEQARQLYDPYFSFALIWSHNRHAPRHVIMTDMEKCLAYKAKFPSLIIGFDIDGPEDEGYSLDHYAREFLEIQRQAKALNTTFLFFFHAGESKLASNQNLFDALLLNSTRVGHGFALARNPLLIEQYKQAGLPLEVCPISNQVLEYVADLQNHPALVFFRKNVPFSISSDDPAIFGYSGTSYDWWLISVAWQLDLVGLKQLSYNSLLFARFPTEDDRAQAINIWTDRWQTWIQSWANN